MIGKGIAQASILSIPYRMPSGVLSASKTGYNMGVFNAFIVLSQVVVTSILVFLVSILFDNQSMHVLINGGISMILVGIVSLRVIDKTTIKINEQ